MDDAEAAQYTSIAYAESTRGAGGWAVSWSQLHGVGALATLGTICPGVLPSEQLRNDGHVDSV
jgi:hypothetical protein